MGIWDFEAEKSPKNPNLGIFIPGIGDFCGIPWIYIAGIGDFLSPGFLGIGILFVGWDIFLVRTMRNNYFKNTVES